MKGSTDQPKVFISYSWTSPQHEQWVLSFAERLSGDGILVILDQWDLKEGQDKYAFMEQMVSNKDINKVLVICDEGYQLKADKRKGGVGTETQLISKEVYENVGQEKFIPIVKEYDSKGKPCIPHFMASRIYIDFSSDGVFENNYEKLLRNLYNRPLLKKPPLGTPPAYITGEEQITLKTSHKVAEIKSAILNDRESAEGLIYTYLDDFLSALEDFRLQGGSKLNFDEDILKSIEKMLPLRDDFIDFVNIVLKYKKEVDLDKFRDFFEKLISFQFRAESITSWNEMDFDNYKFFNYELFLYFVGLLFQLKNYKTAAFFINSQYFFHSSNSNELKNLGVEIFNQYIRSLDEFRNNRLNLRRVSVTADMIKQRATRKDISFAQIIETDLILYYITELEGGYYSWFPRCAVYNPIFSNKIDLFERLISKQHFEKIKTLFKVSNIDELKKKVLGCIERIKERERKYGSSIRFEYSEGIPSLERVISLETIGITD